MANEFWAELFRGFGQTAGSIPDILQNQAEIQNRNKMMAFEMALGKRQEMMERISAREEFGRKRELTEFREGEAGKRAKLSAETQIKTAGIYSRGKTTLPSTEAEQMAANAELMIKVRKQLNDEANKIFGKALENALDDKERRAIMGQRQNYINMGFASIYGIDMGELDAGADSLKGVNYGTDNPYISPPVDSSFTFDPQPADALSF